jgi:hypothetical protein
VRQLARQGRSAAEIAAVVGSTAASVRVKCCLLQIKLSKRGRPKSRPGGARMQKLTVFIAQEDYGTFCRKATDMQKSPDELAGRLLETIISSNLYEAVLDTG